MIDFDFRTEDTFRFDTGTYGKWIESIAVSESFLVNKILYVFVDDEALLDMNRKYLKHDTYTDIITFDYTSGKALTGEIFISMERVRDNAVDFDVEFEVELKRVVAHGVLHMMGYGDKTEMERVMMREKEVEKIKMFHVEQ
ncbi:MAG: rRNA maturation RNase YbeY [Flavobacteriaceae bacterium]